MEHSVEDWAWEIYTKGMRSSWKPDRVKDRKDFKGCSEYDEHMGMAEDLNRLKTKKEVDKCISCGDSTPYIIDTHIDQRKHYIEAAGQLCVKCYRKIYKK